MRVLIVGINFHPEPTGIAPYTTALAEALSKAGHPTRVITGVPHYPDWRNLTGFRGMRRSEIVRGVRVIRRRHYIPNGGRGWARLLMEVTFGLSAISERWHKPDVILCVSPALFASALVLGRAKLSRKSPTVALWVQDLYGPGAVELRSSGGRLARGLGIVEGLVMRSADSVSVIHERFKPYVIGHRGGSSEGVVVNPNWRRLQTAGVEEGERKAFRRRQGWSDSEVVALHTGNMGAKQGLETVVDAAKLAASSGASVRFVLLGEGSQRALLERRAEGCLHLDFLPPVPDREYPTALATADVLLVCERAGLRETSLPSKLTSYLGSGRPIVASLDPEGATAEEVRLSGAGVIVPARSPGLLLETVESLPHAARAARLGQNGLHYARDRLSESVGVGRMVKWLETLHASRGGRAAIDRQRAAAEPG